MVASPAAAERLAFARPVLAASLPASVLAPSLVSLPLSLLSLPLSFRESLDPFEKTQHREETYVEC
jgi:hypothetical protein